MSWNLAPFGADEHFLPRIASFELRRFGIKNGVQLVAICRDRTAARLRYIAGTAWSTKRYMNMRPLYRPQIMQTGAVA